jgi:hypothetical protein
MQISIASAVTRTPRYRCHYCEDYYCRPKQRADGAKPNELLIAPFTSGAPAKGFPLPSTAKLDVALAWTPDGAAVSFVNRVNGVSNVWSQPLTGAGPIPVTHFSSQDIFHFDWSADDRLVLSQGEDITDAMLIRGLTGKL